MKIRDHDKERRLTVTSEELISISGSSQTELHQDRLQEMREKRPTFCDVVPPCRVQGIVRSPARDIRPVRLAGTVLERIRRPNLGLIVKAWEGIDVREPPLIEDKSE